MAITRPSTPTTSARTGWHHAVPPRNVEGRNMPGSRVAVMFIGLLCVAVGALAQPTRLAHPPGFAYWPDADYDPSVPSAESVLGHAIGEDIALSADVRRYFEALAAARPDQVRLVDYGRSWEGRPLWYAVIGSPANLARADAIAAAMRELADPRMSDAARAQDLIRDLPAIVWLGYSVHGNEPGTSDAAMLTAYHLLASRGDARVPAMLANTLVIINPVQNPDGRDRFIHAERATRGPFPDPEFAAAGRDEPWPGGRMNHYVFDLNRDWFALTQPETRLQVPEMLRWMPVLVLDVHEMGTDMTYFFAPEAAPANPHLTRAQLDSAARVGANNARWFDRFGLGYFTGEIFDSFYPGYGSGWPNYHGMVAMVYEQGSSRGLLAQRRDGTRLAFRDTVQSQFIAGLSGIETVAGERQRFLAEFRAYRQGAVEEGRRERVRAYVIAPGARPASALRLAGTLARNGIEVGRATAAFEACGERFAAGSYVVDAAQPGKRLIRTLLDADTPMDPGFVERQRARLARGLPDEIYDVTAWSLPLMYGLRAVPCTTLPKVATTPAGPDTRAAGQVAGGADAVAWLVPWGETPAVRFLAAATRDGLDVDSADEAFVHGGTRYPAGSLVLRAGANPGDARARIERAALASGATVTAVASGRVDEGPDFGSPRVIDMPQARIALLWDDPAERYSAGWARFQIEREFEHPVTLLRGGRLARTDLSRFDVVVLPAEGLPYKAAFGAAGIDNLRTFVQRGGVLVTLGTATRFAADPEVNLVGMRLEQSAAEAAKQGEPGRSKDKPADDKPGPAMVPGVEIADAAQRAALEAAPTLPPTPVSGALLRADVDGEHWLAAGIAPELAVLAVGSDIYAPLRRDTGTTVARFADAERLRLAGVIWEDSRRQFAHKPFVIVQPSGAGLVVAFTQDPNVRAYLDGLAPLFANALFRAPAKARALRPH
jgi:hypothetical protein